MLVMVARICPMFAVESDSRRMVPSVDVLMPTACAATSAALLALSAISRLVAESSSVAAATLLTVSLMLHAASETDCTLLADSLAV